MTSVEKEWIVLNTKNIATEAAEKAAEKAIKLHLSVCPYGKVIGRWKAFMMGGAFILTVLGFGLGAGITKIIRMLK